MIEAIAAIGSVLIYLGALVGCFAFLAFLMDKRNETTGYVLIGCVITMAIGGLMGGAQ